MNEYPGIETVPGPAAAITAYCPSHRQFTDGCAYCETARDVRNQGLHPSGRCDQHCKSLDHYATPVRQVGGTFGKSGLLIYYPDGTTNADKPPDDDP